MVACFVKNANKSGKTRLHAKGARPITSLSIDEGTLTERGWLNTVDLLITVACFA
jgi:hypothetical protein